MKEKPELLMPAGSLEKLKIALSYGADAVYLGGRQYSLRAFADNFDDEALKESMQYAHACGKKVYYTLNALMHNRDFTGLQKHIEQVADRGVDAIIVSDPGVIRLARKCAPQLDIHLSTQANVTNVHSARFFYEQGVKRIILARELSMDEIREIRKGTPEDLELEVFVHGAMCISYSGRCLLSYAMTGRDANQGQCVQPCRFLYHVVEEKRPGEYMPIEQDERGTYLFNSKDLMMLPYLGELMDIGIDSFKVEGRMKTIHYIATVSKAYRQKIDRYAFERETPEEDKMGVEELNKVSHRPFCSGFYYGQPEQSVGEGGYHQDYDFVGLVVDDDREQSMAMIEQRNRFCVGETLEVLSPNRPPFALQITKIITEEGEEIDAARHPQQIVRIPCEERLLPNDILRRKR